MCQLRGERESGSARGRSRQLQLVREGKGSKGWMEGSTKGFVTKLRPPQAMAMECRGEPYLETCFATQNQPRNNSHFHNRYGRVIYFSKVVCKLLPYQLKRKQLQGYKKIIQSENPNAKIFFFVQIAMQRTSELDLQEQLYLRVQTLMCNVRSLINVNLRLWGFSWGVLFEDNRKGYYDRSINRLHLFISRVYKFNASYSPTLFVLRIRCCS